MRTFDPHTLVRPNILALQPYSSARSEFKDSAEVFLDANESPYPTAHNRYPDPLQLALKQRISTRKGIAPDHIFLGNGSDEAIDLLLRIFCRPGLDTICTTPPTYGMYAVAAGIQDVRVVTAPLTPDFQLDVPATLAAAQQAKLTFLCSPNNPTGNLLARDALLALITQTPGIVVLDEAYIDFADAGSSLLPLLHQHPNLVILQTLSKAWGLAGLRLGMAFASSAIIALMNKVKPPYNIGSHTQQLVLTATTDTHTLQAHIAECLQERTRVVTALQQLPIVQVVHPSAANFVLVAFHQHTTVFQRLLAAGIVVRDRSLQPNCTACLRISIGTPAENDILLRTLQHLNHSIG